MQVLLEYCYIYMEMLQGEVSSVTTTLKPGFGLYFNQIIHINRFRFHIIIDIFSPKRDVGNLNNIYDS